MGRNDLVQCRRLFRANARDGYKLTKTGAVEGRWLLCFPVGKRIVQEFEETAVPSSWLSLSVFLAVSGESGPFVIPPRVLGRKSVFPAVCPLFASGPKLKGRRGRALFARQGATVG